MTARLFTLDPLKGFRSKTFAGHKDVVLGAYFSADGETVSHGFPSLVSLSLQSIDLHCQQRWRSLHLESKNGIRRRQHRCGRTPRSVLFPILFAQQNSNNQVGRPQAALLRSIWRKNCLLHVPCCVQPSCRWILNRDLWALGNACFHKYSYVEYLARKDIVCGHQPFW